MICLIMFIGVGCEDLEIENKNNPDLSGSLQLDSDLLGITGGFMNSLFVGMHSDEGPAIATWVAADAGTCSHGNFGMKDFGTEPRLEFDNTPSYSDKLVTETFYNEMYAVISQTNDVLKQTVVGGKVINGDAGQTALVNAVSYYAQGVGHGYLGLFFDRAFVIKEDTDVNTVELLSYSEVITEALVSLDKCIALCGSDTFSIPADWIPGAAYDNVSFGQLANSMAARLLVYSARNSSENSAIDWQKVYGYASKGIKMDYAPLADDDKWYSYYQTYPVYPGWGQIDMRIINLMDPEMNSRWPETSYAGLPNGGVATSSDARLLADFEFVGDCSFKPERGLYHFSSYRYSRLDTYLETWTEPMPDFRVAENDLFLAEALVNLNREGEAATIINAGSRVVRGGLGAVAVTKSDIVDAIFYERDIDLMLSGIGIQYFDMRRRDMLQKGTPLHLPVPASQLEVMLMPFYSFGATVGVAGQDYSNGGWF